MDKKQIGYKIRIILLCIIINFIGKNIAAGLNLPIWLDMVGTCVATYMTGTIGGIIVGFANNAFYAMLNPAEFIYFITSVMAAIAYGFCAKKGYLDEVPKALMSSFWIGILSVAVSTPINLFFYDGYAGNAWGDALVDMLDWYGMPHVFGAVAGEAIIEIVDKQITGVLAVFIIRGLRRNTKGMKKAGTAGVLSLLLVSAALAGAVKPGLVAYAQNSDGDISDNYIGEIFNNSNGMMSSEANVIAETSDGCIWIGSYAGLTRYDGNEFEFIREGGITSVTSMLTDSRDRLWIGTNDGGIARYENGQFTFFTTEDGLPVNSIRCFTEMEDGTIYVGTTDRICRFTTDDRIEVVPLEITYVISMERYGTSLVGVNNNGELFAIREDGELATIGTRASQVYFYCVMPTSRGLMAGSEDKGLYLLNVAEDQIEIQRQINFSLSDIIYIREDRNGHIWLVAENGFGFIDDKGVFREQHYPAFDSSFEWIHEDYQGNIWITSSRYGVLKLCKSQFVDLFGKVGLTDSVVNAVANYSGRLYCATDSGLIVLSKDGEKTVKNKLTARLEGVRVRCLMVDSKNQLWVCTYGKDGLLCYDGNSITAYNRDTKGTTSDRFRCIMELTDGTIVVGTANGINFIRGGEVVATVTAEDGLANTQILSLIEGEDGIVYAGTDGAGIYVIKNGKITENYTTEDGLSSNIILRIVPYETGYFVVTSNSLCYMEKGKAMELTEFPYFNNYDVILNGDEAFVLSSAGIYLVNAKELKANDSISYRLYNVNDGLLAGLTANSWNYVDEGGNLYFCCNSGAFAFYPWQNTVDTEYKYGIISVTCGGEEILEENGTYYIPAGNGKIVLSASVRNYSPVNVKVRFFIEGYDEESQLYSYNEIEPISISSLGHGSYNVHMQILDTSGRNLISEKVYILEKEAQFWENFWYKIYLALVVVEIIAFFTWTVVIMVSASKRKAELEELRGELETKVHDQMEEIKEQKDKTDKLFRQTVAALSEAVDVKDRYTSGHSRRVAAYSRAIAAKMGKSQEEQEEIFFAGLLHDVGKIRIPDDIINKPGKLTDEEFDYIKLHPVAGYHILRDISENRMLSEGARFHHERYDGKGYPNGLKGNNIPEIARIIGVADAYDAMASNRSYRKALPQEVVRAEIEKGKGTQFDPVIADIMIKMIDEDEEYLMRQNDILRKNILIVDDESMNVRMVKFVLKDEKMFDIYGANSGKEALEVLAGNRIDLILLDIEMPEMDGFETLSKIREKYSIPIVFMTADKDLTTIKRADALGVDDYLTKPFLPIALKEIVHSILSR